MPKFYSVLSRILDVSLFFAAFLIETKDTSEGRPQAKGYKQGHRWQLLSSVIGMRNR